MDGLDLKQLDSKEYPLAEQPLPQEIKQVVANILAKHPDARLEDVSPEYSSARAPLSRQLCDVDSVECPDIPAAATAPQRTRIVRALHNSSIISNSPQSLLSQYTTADDDEPMLDSNVIPSPQTEIPNPVSATPAVIASSPRTHNMRLDIAVDVDASLPSPRLSPTLAAQLESDSPVVPLNDQLQLSGPQGSMEDEILAQLQLHGGHPGAELLSLQSNANSLMMLRAFDRMSPDSQTYMMYQMLRRCSRKTLRVAARTVNPALQCDFIKLLPTELSYHVLSYLSAADLCRAAQVSKWWRHVIDSNETGWKDLFDRDGLKLPPGELQRAIQCGWGWQDPGSFLSAERDIRPTEDPILPQSADSFLTTTGQYSQFGESSSRAGYSKRKRIHEYATAEDEQRPRIVDFYRKTTKGEGPFLFRRQGTLSAANEAAKAIPDVREGLDSIRNLHLFKSLYRRHHLIRESWMNGQVEPKHIAFQAHPQHVITCLQFDDDKIITGSDDTEIHVYETSTGLLRRRLKGHEGGVWALQYEGNTLVSGSTDRSVRVWNIAKGICTHVFLGHTSTVRCLQILMPSVVDYDAQNKPIMMPKKPLIITGSRDYNLRVWKLPMNVEKQWLHGQAPPDPNTRCPWFVRALTGHNHSVRAIAAHGDTLVSGSYDNMIRVWKISTGECRFVLTGHAQKVYSVVLDTERNRCISGSMDSMVKVWNLETGECIFTLEGHSHLVGLLDLREGRLVSAAADSTLRIWDPEDGACRTVLAAHTGAITCFQHDARKVISGSEKAVKMWDISNGVCKRDLLTRLSAVWQVKFDSRRCVAAVQRDNVTYLEILDFGAVRDGVPVSELGRRHVINGREAPDSVGEEGRLDASEEVSTETEAEAEVDNDEF